MKTTTRVLIAVAVLVGRFVAVDAAGQTTGPRMPPLIIESMYGPDLYHSAAVTAAQGGHYERHQMESLS
jgi:hypothetical protein